jgi:TPP-dependent trihydroxycyclohexane-1,2-dione (THcHDO) dehydratase
VGRRADNADALAAALRDAREGKATMVIHCPTRSDRPLLDTGAFWDLGVPETAADARTRHVAEAHVDARARLQRWYR